MKSLFERFNRTHSNLHLNEIKNEEKPGQLTICISGNIETYNSDAFRDEITMLIRHNDTITSLVFDFLNVLYISSTGVGALIKLIRITKEKRIDLFFTNVNDKIQAVIKVLGLAQLVKVIDDKDSKGFPIIIQCPGCEKNIKITHSGKNSCPHCKKVFSLNEYGATM